MTIIEGVMKDNIFIDFDADIQYGSDQMYISYPLKFATVGFMLQDTALLSTLADRIRKDKGFAPMNPMDEYTGETCDQNGWYDFYYFISDIEGGRGDSTIEFVVVSPDAPDNEETYTIDLTDEERGEMYRRINEELKAHLNRSCRQLLDEADMEMREDE